MKGLVYVFLRKDGAPLPPGCAGHVAWGFTVNMPNTDVVCGSTENPSGSPIVLPGFDNGYWESRCDLERQMLGLMQQRKYDGFKVATVREPQPDKACEAAQLTRGNGYTALGNNCLDHAHWILAAYGVKDLPWLQTHPAPNDRFAQFNGEYHNL